MTIPNPDLPVLKKRALLAVARQQIIHQAGRPAFIVYSVDDAKAIADYLYAPETVDS